VGPAARSTRAERTTSSELPLQLTSFVGRQRELADVVHVVQHARLVTLTGIGGIGKTRLALAAATQVGDRFADGVCFVGLAPLADGQLLPQLLASALGVGQQTRRTVLDGLVDALHSRQLLLILDNCEHVIGACADLADRLLRASQGLVILATSREPLGVVGEMIWRVPPLSLPGAAEPASGESMQLFAERARAVLPEFEIASTDTAAVAAICRSVEGLPLAIELAAARIAMLTPQQIAERIKDHLYLLTRGPRSAPPRHQTLRAALAWSYDLLAEPERILFERLSIFAGGATLEAVGAVCGGRGVEAPDVVDLLRVLVDKSLVIAAATSTGTSRYRLLEPVRQYAAERLAAWTERDIMRDWHAEYFVLAERLEPRPSADAHARLAQLEPEHGNIRVALRWLVDRHDIERAQRLGAAQVRFWFLRGELGEGRAWLTELLGLPGGSAPSATRAKLLYGVGLLALYQGDYDAAYGPTEEAVHLWRIVGDKVEEAYALYVLGRLEFMRGDEMRGRRWLQEGLRVGSVAGHPNVAALNLYGLADAALNDGQFEEARARAQEARMLATDPLTTSYALRILGDVSFRQTDYPAARALLEDSLAHARQVAGQPWIAAVLPLLAHVLIEQADDPAALAALDEALTLYRRLRDRQVLARALEAAAHLAISRGHAERGLRLVGAAAAVRETAGAPISTPDRDTLEGWLAPARTQLGHAGAEAALTAGRDLDPDAANALALDVRALSS
jgi:predicted ATPase